MICYVFSAVKLECTTLSESVPHVQINSSYSLNFHSSNTNYIPKHRFLCFDSENVTDIDVGVKGKRYKFHSNQSWKSLSGHVFQPSHLLNEVATVVLVRKSKQAASDWWIQIQ